MPKAENGILINIAATKGSTPRDQGATLWVGVHDVQGSIGGGSLEANAIAQARKMLDMDQTHHQETIRLGPEIGQCCGGVVELDFQSAPRPGQSASELAIFGAGHVGSKLARLAKSLGYCVALYDSRDHIELEDGEPYEHLPHPERHIAALAPNTHIVILTHDHALDFRIAEAALLREDIGFVGMIGSASKAAQFRNQFSALGTRLDRLQCPIAKSGMDKRPISIALAIFGEIHKIA